ncbi:MAG: cytochrome c-type biogenesis protein [Paracoccaceae bacterium]
MIKRAIILALGLMLVLPLPAAQAVQPDEVLADPVLEARARALSALIRCPVCQGESIDDSNATIARDLRLILRERLVAGDSDAAALAYLTDRYGEFILFRPTPRGINLILWIAGPAMFLLALTGAGLYLRRRAAPALSGAEADPLSKEEEARLRDLLER